MREDVILITGANGEIGHGLINSLYRQNINIIALDVAPLDKALRPKVTTWIVGDILDQMLLGRLVVEASKFAQFITFAFHPLNQSGIQPGDGTPYQCRRYPEPAALGC